MGECRSADFADINVKCIRFSAVQLSNIFGKSRNPKVLLWGNVDLHMLQPGRAGYFGYLKQ